MPFRRGATLPVATTLGHAESSDLGPTAGNGFYKRWPDDLALLSDIGISDLRITFDWARLQPKPGEFAGDWVERYEHVLGAAEAIGISVWATMYDSGVPKWFANEGGVADDEALATWWPRWIERVADRFGEHVAGWIPFAIMPSDLPTTVWDDTWRVLGGGDAPTVGSFDAERDLDRIAGRLGQMDAVGIALTTDLDQSTEPNEDDLRVSGERWEQALGTASDSAGGMDLVITEFSPHHDDPEVGGLLVERFVEVTEPIEQLTTAFLTPAIAGPDSPLGLFDRDRAPQPAASAYLDHDLPA
jgi:beta-glucosidase